MLPVGGVSPQQPGRPRRRGWPYVLLAIALLLVVSVGTGLGVAYAVTTLTSRTTASSASTSSASSASASSSSSALELSVQSAIQTVLPSVVKVTSVAGRQEAIGSGDILNTSGYIVTNDHVVQGFTSFTVALSDGTSQSAQLVGQDPQDDLAVLKIAASSSLHPITIADSTKVQVGEFTIAVGNPLDLGESATFGIVSALNRTASEAPSGPAGILTGLIQTSAALNPGNSGGALVNLQGQLIGIPTLGAINSETGTTANDIGYAISSSRVTSVTTQLIQQGKVTSSGQGFLGIQGQDVTAQVAAANNLSVQSGVLVAGFAADAAGQSPAQQAGVQAGDVIIAVNGQAISSGNDLAAVVAGQSPGTKLTLTIMRGANQHTISVTLGERPTNVQG